LFILKTIHQHGPSVRSTFWIFVFSYSQLIKFSSVH
ncbi:hypothetical protein T4B_4266, partial [Trichinella pseudospiralis]